MYPLSSSGSNGTFVGNGTIINGNSTSSRNATTTAVLPSHTPTSSTGTSSKRPPSHTTSKLGVGLGAALGFAAVVILLVLWHIIKAHRRERLQRWLQEDYTPEDAAHACTGGAGPRPDGDERQRREQEIAVISSSSTPSSGTVSPYPGKGKQKEAVVTTTSLIPAEARQTETRPQEMSEVTVRGKDAAGSPLHGRQRQQGRARRSLGGSRWERRDGPGRPRPWAAPGIEEADADRPKFSFEGVVQSEDSIERRSQLRNVVQANRKGGEVQEQGDSGAVPEKGERDRLVYEMEPH